MKSVDLNSEQVEHIVIGKITRPHGIKGAIKVEPFTRNLDLFQLIDEVKIVKPDGSSFSCHINKAQKSNKQIILTVDQVTSRNEAELLRNCSLEIPRTDSVLLENDGFYYDELIGFKVVTMQNQDVGILTDIMENPANEIFIITKDGQELLIPNVDEFVQNIDKVKGVITINPIEGLLEYN